MTPSPQPSTRAKTLLVYFSRPGENYWEGGRRDLDVGNTKRLARMIADRIDCDEHEILAADPYPDAYDPTVQRNVREQDDDARPRIAGELPDLSEYSTVLLGSPVWNVRAPMIMSTFIEQVDLTGKRVLPFVTYAVSGMAGVDQDYRDALPGSDVADGLAVRGEDVESSGADVEEWLRANGLLWAPPERWTWKVGLSGPPTARGPLVRWEATDRHAHGPGRSDHRPGRPEHHKNKETRT